MQLKMKKVIGVKILFKIIKSNEEKETTCIACIVLIIGFISLWLSRYPVALAYFIGIPSSMYVETYMLLYAVSLFIYLSPLFFLNNKWKSISLNVSFIVISIVLAQHYIDVIDSPYSYLDLNNHGFHLNYKALYV